MGTPAIHEWALYLDSLVKHERALLGHRVPHQRTAMGLQLQEGTLRPDQVSRVRWASSGLIALTHLFKLWLETAWPSDTSATENHGPRSGEWLRF